MRIPSIFAILISVLVALPAVAAPEGARQEPREISLPAWEEHRHERRSALAALGSATAEQPYDALCEQLGTAALPDGPCETWVNRYRDMPNAQAEGIVVSPDRTRVFVTGSAEGSGGWPNLDFLTMALDARTGERLWTSTYAGPGLYDTPVPLQPIALSPDGATLYVTGGSFTGQERNGEFVTIAYNAATGAERWRSFWNGDGSRLDFPYHVIPSPDGKHVYVAGDSAQEIGGWNYYDAVLIALDAATGELEWEAMYTDEDVVENDYSDGLQLTQDGERLFLTIGSMESCPACPGLIDLQSVTVAFQATGEDAGERLWKSVHRGVFNQVDRPTDTALTPDGSSLIVTTIAAIPGQLTDYGVLAHDTATGQRRWYTTWGTTGEYDLPAAVVLAPNGATAFVTGQGSAPSGPSGLSNRDFVTVALDVATGSQRWVARDTFDSQWWNNQPDEGEAIGVTPDGSTVVVAGLSVGANYDDYWTIAYDAVTGAKRWSARFDNQHDVDRPQALAVDATSVYVAGAAGYFDGDFVQELATVAYPLVRPPLASA